MVCTITFAMIMKCPYCRGPFQPAFSASKFHAKENGDWYKVLHQERPFCHNIVIGISELKLKETSDILKERIMIFKNLPLHTFFW